jgi:putative GTP pyrophosphokinase
MTHDALKHAYEHRYHHILAPLADQLREHLHDNIREYPRIDRITARAKSISRFLEKATKQESQRPKYTQPLDQIQDQLGARIVTFYLQDVESLSKRILDYYAPIEERRVLPDSPKQFGYEGKHYVLFLPDDLKPAGTTECPHFFELQIKTLFQHAWGEAEHDLCYKPAASLSIDQRRLIAYTAAQAWGADHVFQQLATELLTN